MTTSTIHRVPMRMKPSRLCAVLIAAWLVGATAPPAVADPPNGGKPSGERLKPRPIPPGAIDLSGPFPTSPTTERPIGEGPGGPEGPGDGTQPQQAAAPSSEPPVAAPVSALSGASIRIGCLVKKGKALRVVRCKRRGHLRRALALRFSASATTSVAVKVTRQPRRAKGKKTKRGRARRILTRTLTASAGQNRYVLPLKRVRAGNVVIVKLFLPGSGPIATARAIAR